MGNEKRTRARKARSRRVDKKAIEEGSRRRREGAAASKSHEAEGTISAVLAGTMFKVKLSNGHELLAHISGKMRKRFIRLVVGDRVKLEVSPYDIDKARITYRLG
ncbi:MAG: translation initiation factor IF-1 [Verrucomicrobiota bacterium]|jgi:translation initiation factor IF-1|nr:translation initiation factor IF-1 [Verrucomicrobiales bacterium]MEC9035483.1 translation initiation factor IF-1 [Verrucomicrobiota bacterium]MEC9111934.1 translation initiation factor IF-1 [Verrucomicrobiota bacterium]MED5471915.1 translation initiation factor IF-1 [Verrucomicrobiota bacterium]MEE2966710.1 translation initiation factor IF-1 [Verrucomicrobiota bacterium]|tara:strand:- start:1723 stop:2037 length:315 start_codon:yes stop_codon:yes gene_type:complete